MPEACKHASVCRKTMRKLLMEGDISGDRIGSGPHAHWRIDRDSIDSYFNRADEKVLAKVRALGL